jgi:hypothetical protein
MNHSSNRRTIDRVAQPGSRVLAPRNGSESAGEMCEQLRLDREAISRLEDEGGPANPVFPEQSQELPASCNPIADTQSSHVGSSVSVDRNKKR